MNNITFETLPHFVGEIINKLNEIEAKLESTPQQAPHEQQKDVFSEYIQKKEVRGKLASSSTLWNWEKQGKLKTYGIGGKRYYKRSELDNLIKPIK